MSKHLKKLKFFDWLGFLSAGSAAIILCTMQERSPFVLVYILYLVGDGAIMTTNLLRGINVQARLYIIYAAINSIGLYRAFEHFLNQ